MATPLRYTLVTDGSSDRALLPIITWLLQQQAELVARDIAPQWADLRRFDKEPGLAGKIAAALQHYPCGLLFVHRDAESNNPAVIQQRRSEILQAMNNHQIPYVCAVPVRMTEAWLLHDAGALHRAADNPNSRATIKLPPLRRLETLPTPRRC